MTCERCEEAAREGCRFCPECGEPLDSCTMCSEYARKGYEYCGRCGRCLANDKKEDFIVEKTVFITVICIATMLIIELACMLWYSADTYSYLRDKALGIFLLLPQMVTVGEIGGTALQLFWIFIVVAIVASCIVVAYQSRAILDRRSSKYIQGIRSTPAYWIALFFGAYLILSIAVSAIADGLPTGVSPESLFTYADAAVWEEVASRMVPIGVPMVIVAGLCGKRDCLKYLFGGFGMTRVALVLMVVSAIIFGMAHEGAWGASKVLPTVIGGLMMSYLFIRFGIHASIAYHFLLDYSAVIADAVGPEIFSFIFILVAITGFVAVAGVLKYAKEGISGIRDMPVWIHEKETKAEEPEEPEAE